MSPYEASGEHMKQIFFPNRKSMASIGFASVSHVPVLFKSTGEYRRIENRYLRERATGDWFPPNGKPYPSEKTLKKMADILVNFSDWMDARHYTLSSVAYDDVLQYQREQTSGTWSYRGRPLQASTANQRADEVTHFLTWAAFRGLRKQFAVKRFFARGQSHMGGASIMVRAGRAKQSKTTRASHFILPTPEAVRAWLALVKEKRGYAKYLACRLILEVGPRRAEVEALDVSQWPSATRIQAALDLSRASVPLPLLITKGNRARTVDVPVHFAAEVRRWIDEKRQTHEHRFFVRSGRKEKPTRLFLGDHPSSKGTPISAETIYRVFKQVQPNPLLWSPHIARHVFACFFILHALEIEARPHGGLNKMGADWITHRGQYWLMILRDQLGHVSITTTEIYLRWLVTACGIAELASGWHRYLEEDEHTANEI